MIYGRDYSVTVKRCDRCDEAKPKYAGECDICGEPGCEACMQRRDFGADSDTGYHDTALICSECLAKDAA